MEEIPALAVDDLETPDLCLGFYDVIVAVDVRFGETTVISTGLSVRGDAAAARARNRLDQMIELLSARPSTAGESPLAAGACRPGELVANFTPDAYCEAVRQAVEYIYAGDIFQVNLSQRFSTPQIIDAWTLYSRLREINPAPFAAFLSCGDLEVICASPERFLKLDGNKVETRPIKGTRPRGRTPEEDVLLRQALLDSEKDRAELMMIVDLERNIISFATEN